MGKTIISWATYTVNLVSGCSKPIETDSLTNKRFISPECVRCYAESMSLRRGWSTKPWTEANAAENVRLRPERLRDIRRIVVRPPVLPPSLRERIFICSMGDIFHDQVPDSFLREMWDVLIATPHIYQLVTKRPERAAKWPGPWPDHIWLGATCGTPKTAHRVDALRDSGAKVRFVSGEPLLEDMRRPNMAGIHQWIVGGESGSGFRPMNMQWARDLRDQCKDEGVAYFFKQDAAYVTETRPWLVERDGTANYWRQFPGELAPPVPVELTPKQRAHAAAAAQLSILE
jgi:protein gp37